MTGLHVLTNNFNKTVALSEFGANCFLAFFVLLSLYIFKRAKNTSKIIQSLIFTLITFVAIVMFWGLMVAVSDDTPIMYINPISVLFDAVVETLNTKGSIFKSFIGVPYILGFQFLGSMSGFILFVAMFYLFKKIPSNYFENQTSVTLKEILFQNHNEKTLAFTIKETIFVFLLAITITMTPRIPHTYSLNHFTSVILNMIILFTILTISSYFNFFAFHIFLATGFAILNLILADDNKKKTQIIKHYFINLAITIAVPIIVALITIGIYKGGKHTYVY
ncbi:hypothetical protein MCFN_02510 [Mycoplasmopsis californica]|uniref:Uncharacterized protein n=1 Tax=Mycoplasmopsis californica TaxID=2113 RepID=A0A059XS40_9BACT|nr:hypothetical protein [Mycoplasmopsis californica]AIA29628.1 hypothetical protein MCFN_02510 [Mycoplasmopsis californica]